jgi:uncharacterized damage-inducible protein DinB
MSSAMSRGFQLDQLRKTPQIIRTIINGITAQDATTYRDGGTGWTALEVLGHLRDYEAIFLERLTLTNEQPSGGPEPALPNPNPDQLAAEGRYNEQDLQATYDEWGNRREALVTYLQSVTDEGWQRVGVHPKRGRMTLQDQLSLYAWHDINHIEQMTRILAEQKTS